MSAPLLGNLSPKPYAGRSAGYLELLGGLMEQFAQTQDIEQTLKLALQRIADTMQAEAASLFLLEGEPGDSRRRLVCKVCVGPSDITGLALPENSGIAGRALAANAAQIVADVRLDPDFVPPSGLDGFVVRSILCAPLSVRSERLGVVELINRKPCGSGAEQLFTPEDTDLLAALAAAAALAISNARLTQSMVEQERLRRELELAAAVQRNLLPPPQAADAAVHGLSRPARGVSGDFYDILPLPDGRIVFALADVSGKGMNAALVMVKTHTLFRSWAKRLADPGRLLARIEAELCETMSFGMFVTMVVGIYDPRRHEVRFSNAGHEPPLWRDTLGIYRDFPAGDPPLGIQCKLENNRYREVVLPLAGGTFYLFTDGATEGRLADGSMPGSEGMRGLIEAHVDEPAAQRLEHIAAHFGGELRDDLTLLLIDDAAKDGGVQRRRRQRRSAAVLVSQTIPASTDQLKIVRRLVEAAARQSGASIDWAADLALAVDEACQNIIRHGYRGCEGRIELRVRRRDNQLQVELVDFAPSVKQDDCKGRRLDELRPGGLGTHFMHALTDRVRFLLPPKGAGNRLLLSKNLQEENAS